MKTLVKNSGIFRDFDIQKRFDAGIVLEGWEVKSIKAGSASLKESHVSQYKGEIWIYGMHVARWKFAPAEVEEVRPRKLLLHKSEVNFLIGNQKRNGLAIVPIRVYENKGFVKIEIALAKGLKKGDKREKLREKESKRNIESELKKMGY